MSLACCRDYRYLQINQRLRELHPEVLAEIHAGIGRMGGRTTANEETGLVTSAGNRWRL